MIKWSYFVNSKPKFVSAYYVFMDKDENMHVKHYAFGDDLSAYTKFAYIERKMSKNGSVIDCVMMKDSSLMEIEKAIELEKKLLLKTLDV